MNMVGRKALYVDTNLLVYAHAYTCRGSNAPDHPVFEKGALFEDCLDLCGEKGIRVFTSWFTFLELQNIHVGSEKRRYWLVELRLPGTIVFGRSEYRLQLEKKGAIPAAAMQVLREGIDGWLRDWPFREVVEFAYPKDSRWAELARTIMRYTEVSPSDCLHLAAAMDIECDYFMTEDSGLRRVLAELARDVDFRGEVRSMNLSGVPRATKVKTFPTAV